MRLVDGWLDDVSHVVSPNYNLRPCDVSISLLVVHGISLPPGEFGGGCIQAFFQNRLDRHAHPYFAEIADVQVSAHCLIERDGTLVQFVPFDKRGWHPGHSSFQQQVDCNNYSIGVELEGCDDVPYTESQYQKLAELSVCLMAYYPELTTERICGHCDVAPGRKTDPGPSFDWALLRKLIAALTNG